MSWWTRLWGNPTKEDKAIEYSKFRQTLTNNQCLSCKLTMENASEEVLEYMNKYGMCYKPHSRKGITCANFKK